MMMAAAAHAEDYKNAPPPELIEAWNWRRWGPPNAGGRLDQPAGLVQKMTVAENVYNAVSAWMGRNPGEEQKFIDNYPVQYAIVKRIRELRRNV